MALYRAILHTGGVTADAIRAECPDIPSPDIDQIITLNQFLDGKEAIVTDSFDGSEEFWYMGMKNSADAKEAAYLMEQDSETGTFINNRFDFDRVWDSEEYSSDVWYVFKKEQVEIIERI